MERVDLVPGTDFKIIQDKKSFSYGTDAIFLSSFSKPRGLVVDLGTGSGIIPLRIVNKESVKKIYGIEIQPQVYERAKRSIALNVLEEKIEILNMDLNDLHKRFAKCEIDTVISNPPYLKTGGAIVNAKENFAISRHEIACNLEDIIRVSSYLLKPLGKFFLVHRPDRLTDIFCLMREYDLEPKWIRFVYPKLGKAPNLVLIEGVKGGNKELRFFEPLIVYDEDGRYTDDIYEIYNRK